MAIKKKKRDYDYVNDDEEIGGRVSSPSLPPLPPPPRRRISPHLAALSACQLSPRSSDNKVGRREGMKEAIVLHFMIYIAVFLYNSTLS